MAYGEGIDYLRYSILHLYREYYVNKRPGKKKNENETDRNLQ